MPVPQIDNVLHARMGFFIKATSGVTFVTMSGRAFNKKPHAAAVTAVWGLDTRAGRARMAS